MTREEKEQIGKYVLQMARLLEDGCYQQEMLLKAVHIIDESLEQEPRKGHWIDTDEWRETVDGFEQWGYFRKCSKCGYVFKFLEIDNYCPNCGADMRTSEE